MRAKAAALVPLFLMMTLPVDASPSSRAATQEAYALAYGLHFAACYNALERASAMDPRDPAPARAIAAVTWVEILFAQGVATFEAFTGEISKSDIARPAAPPSLVSRFHTQLARAHSLAADQSIRANDADAQYQIGATEALAALYGATVEGRLLGSFAQGRRAVAAMERVRQAPGPQRREAALVLGMSEYTVSTMSWPIRALAKLSGLSGNRQAGLALLEEAASSGAETESDALLLLMIIDNREGRHSDAVQRIRRLQQRHPDNRLWWLNDGATELQAGRAADAMRALTEGLNRSANDLSPVVLGESALWLAHRGTALTRLQRDADALADLDHGLAAGPREWVRGRIHRQLGDLALRRGDRRQARQEYETALEWCSRAGDRAEVDAIKQQLKSLSK